MSKFSIIIPTFNEACNLPLLFSDLSIISEEKEIIVVDACSTDKTVDIANLYGVKLYSSKERNRGFQLDIGISDGIKYNTDEIYLSDRKSDHIISSTVIDDNQIRIISYSLSSSA